MIPIIPVLSWFSTFTAADIYLTQSLALTTPPTDPNATQTQTYTKVLKTATSGATAGLVLAMTTLLTDPKSLKRPLSLFPDFPAEFVRNLPASVKPVYTNARFLARGAISHGAFFTLYKGLEQGVLRDRGGEMGGIEKALVRFFAGGVASLGYRAAASGLIKSEVERLTLTPKENMKFLGRSFLVAGVVVCVGDALRDEAEKAFLARA
ncbi:hypothetical protein HDU67_004076 [Dinochytrium kinnereticum]|nr:hypothetical protein HDU67_004076 [Dinochytrium kinnereticum]